MRKHKSLSRQVRRQQERNIRVAKNLEQRLSPQLEQTLKAREQAAHEVEVEIYFTIFGLALEELHGFKQKRILNVWRKADEYVGLIQNDEETFDSLKEMLRNRADVECSFD